MAAQAPFERKILFNTFWAFAGSSGNQLLNVVIFILLARTLDARQFGIMAMAAVFVDILNTVCRIGLVEALLQRPELDRRTLSTAFWTSFGFGTALALLVFVCAGSVAAVFGMPELAPVMQVLCISTVFSSLGTVPEALIKHGFGFKALSMRMLTATGLGGAVGITMALNGYGVYSLVAQQLIAMLLLTLVVWVAKPFRPAFAYSVADAKSLTHTGMAVMATDILALANSRINDLVVGFFMGPVMVGYLRVAWKLLDSLNRLLISPVVQVCWVMFSKLAAQPAKLKNAYLKMVQVCSLATFPFAFGASLMAPELIPMLFGAHWAESVPLFQILCFYMLGQTVFCFLNPMLAALKQSGWVFRLAAIQTAGITVAALAAVPFGLVAIPAAYLMVTACIALISMLVTRRFLGAGFGEVGRGLWPAASASVLMAVVVYGLKQAMAMWMPAAGAGVLLPVCGGVGVFVYGATLLVFHRTYIAGLVKDLKHTLRPPLATAEASPAA